jgi:hypothetical protein
MTAVSSVSTRSGDRASPGEGSTTKGKAGRGRAEVPVEAGVGGTDASRARTVPTSSSHFTTTSLQHTGGGEGRQGFGDGKYWSVWQG